MKSAKVEGIELTKIAERGWRRGCGTGMEARPSAGACWPFVRGVAHRDVQQPCRRGSATLCGRDDCYVHLCGRDDSYLHTCWHGNRYLHVEVCDPRPATDFRLLA